LGCSIVKQRESILATIEHGFSNGRIESMNAKIRLITRIAFGFKSPDALIALAMLSLGGSNQCFRAENNPRTSQESRKFYFPIQDGQFGGARVQAQREQRLFYCVVHVPAQFSTFVLRGLDP
jgi:hypothetical protein